MILKFVTSFVKRSVFYKFPKLIYVLYWILSHKYSIKVSVLTWKGGRQRVLFVGLVSSAYIYIQLNQKWRNVIAMTHSRHNNSQLLHLAASELYTLDHLGIWFALRWYVWKYVSGEYYISCCMHSICTTCFWWWHRNENCRQENVRNGIFRFMDAHFSIWIFGYGSLLNCLRHPRRLIH